MYCYHCMEPLETINGACRSCGKTIVDEALNHLKAGTLLNERYLTGYAIGEGGFGITYIGLDTTLNTKVAIKEFFPAGYAARNHNISNEVGVNYKNEGEYFRNARDKFLTEARIIAMFKSEPSIVDVSDMFEENNTAYIIMEYIDGKTLSYTIEQNGVFSVRETFEKMLPVMNALRKMHGKGIIHRDISPENIMVTNEGAWKLMDFGSARYFSSEGLRALSVIYKPGYAPAEQYTKNGNQGAWTDVYGLCATIYKCITGVTPVDSLSRMRSDTLERPSQRGVRISAGLEQVLLYGLEVDETHRCRSMDELAVLTETALQRQDNNVERTVLAAEEVRDFRDEFSYGDRKDYQNIEEKQQKPKALVAAIALSSVALIAVAAFLVILFVTHNRDDEKKESAAATSVETTVPQQTNDVEKLVPVTTVPPTTVHPTTLSPTTTAPKNTAVIQPEDDNQQYVDVEKEVEQIRKWYYATQDNPGTFNTGSEIVRYTKDGATSKISVPASANGWKYSRWYFFRDNKLYFAFVFDGKEEHRLYFTGGNQLIRYIDENGSTQDYGDGISCAIKDKVLSESYGYLNSDIG